MKSLVKSQEQVAGPKHCLSHTGETAAYTNAITKLCSNFTTANFTQMTTFM